VDEQRIDPHIPVSDRSQREDGTFSKGDFAYDAEKDLYTCPNGKALRTTGTPADRQHISLRLEKGGL
jgi:hypothetical protein